MESKVERVNTHTSTVSKALPSLRLTDVLDQFIIFVFLALAPQTNRLRALSSVYLRTIPVRIHLLFIESIRGPIYLKDGKYENYSSFTTCGHWNKQGPAFSYGTV